MRTHDGQPFRLTRSEAQSLIGTGGFKYTSKEATKAWYKRLAQVSRNEEALKHVDFTTSQKVQQNFVQEEKGKVVGYRLRKMNSVTYTMPADHEEAEAKKNWLHDLVERTCINPHDHTIKQGILSTIAIFFGFLLKKKVMHETTESVDLPQYQRYVLGYGSLKQLKVA